MRAGPNGVFRFDGLAPGKWQVLVRDVELPTDGITISSGYADAPEVRWSCAVIAGQTTRQELESNAK